MQKLFLTLVLLIMLVQNNYSEELAIKKSTVLFTRIDIATDFNYDKYKSDGIFWGHMPYYSIENDTEMQAWAAEVEEHTSNGKYYFARGEFDWGWQWMIDFMDDPASYWAMDLDSSYILWTGAEHNGYYHSWQSHHGPDFLAWLKYQVDRMLMAPISHMMFDSQTSASRTLHWLGGDFSVHAMNGFRKYMAEKYSASELSALGISDISSFNYRNYLLNRGFTLQSYIAQANSIEGAIPLYKDFVYFNRQRLNEMMEELFEYIDTKKPGMSIGATTNLIEPRGFLFSDRLTYLAGEFFHAYNQAESPPFTPIMHFKAAESIDKTLLFFPYPDAFQDLQRRNAPGQARAWIAQAYAMGSIFIVPGDVWVGASGTWDPGWENHAYIYAFIKENSQLFDGYKAHSNVALPYSVYASLLEPDMDGSKTSLASVKTLIEENISFDYQIFGDPDQAIMPRAGKLNEYDVVVTDNDVQYFTYKQKQVLDSVAAKSVPLNNISEVKKRISWKIDVLSNYRPGNKLISALPRISTKAEDNYVIHLINRKYDSSTDRAQKHSGVSVKIPAATFPKTITGAKLHKPGEVSVNITMMADSEGNVILDLGDFDTCWGILELFHSASAIAENAIAVEISVYPNPSVDFVKIENKTNTQLQSVEVFNLQGVSLFILKQDFETIDISNLKSGVYFLKVNIGDSFITKRFVKSDF